MIHKKQALSHKQIDHILRYQKFLPDINTILFFDIETTGLFWKNSSLYLIGCISKESSDWYQEQWFAETPGEEEEILCQFMNKAANYSCFIHFNGNSFDVPYLQHKCSYYKVEDTFSSRAQLDLYQVFSSLKNFLPTPSMKQKDLEMFLQTNRKDPYTGKDLITIYKKYVSVPNELDLNALLLHNAEDIDGLLHILNFYAMLDLFRGNVASECTANLIPSIVADNVYDLLIQTTTPFSFPTTFSLRREREYLTWKGNMLSLKVSIQDGNLRFYYPDYKNYYYLPEEDYAIHKSLGTYVDKGHRVNATKETCYQNIPWNEDFLEAPESLLQYVTCFLQHL